MISTQVWATYVQLDPVYKDHDPIPFLRPNNKKEMILSRPLLKSFAIEFTLKFDFETFAGVPEGRYIQLLTSSCLFMKLNKGTLDLGVAPEVPAGPMVGNKLDRISLDFRGKDTRSLSRYVDLKPHHFVIQRDGVTGYLELWLDGVPLTVKASPGNLKNNCSGLTFNTNFNSDKFIGTLAKVAVYDHVLGATYIKGHANARNYATAYTYKMGSADKSNYLANLNLTFPKTLDPKEYVDGAQVPTVGYQTAGNMNDPLTQFQNSPHPRYKNLAVPFQKNFNWMGVYLSGHAQKWRTDEMDAAGIVRNGSVRKLYVLQKYADMQKELAQNWNYGVVQEINLPGFTNVSLNGPEAAPAPSSTLATNIPVLNLMRENPQFSRDFIVFGTFMNNLITPAYLVNYNGTAKYLSPAAPKDLAFLNGEYFGRALQERKNYINDALVGNSSRANGRTFDRVNDNGEYSNFTNHLDILSQDSAIIADEMSYSGSSTPASATDPADAKRWDNYLSSRNSDYPKALRDGILSKMPGLEYTLYSITAQGNQVGYEYDRKTHSGFSGSDRGCFIDKCSYSTPDFYPRTPSNWSFWSGAWHGLKWIENGRAIEIARGDRLNSPFVSAGWSPVAEANLTPSQYLGNLKLLGALGAEFFYTGYFTLGEDFNNDGIPDFGDSRLWAWQALAPSYAQAAFSQVSDFLRQGELLKRPALGTWDAPNYRFFHADPRVVTYIRKMGSKYLITSAIQTNSNEIANSPKIKSVGVTIEGKNVVFSSRRQGSIYVYDLTNPAKPTLKQIDGWHESGHFTKWAKTIVVEAENSDSEIKYAYLNTNFSKEKEGEFETTMNFSRAASKSDSWLNYSFQPRSQNGVWSIKVKGGSTDGESAQFSARLMKRVDGNWTIQGKELITNLRGKAMNWKDLTPVGIALENGKDYRLDIKPLSKNLVLDSIMANDQVHIKNIAMDLKSKANRVGLLKVK